MRKKPLECVLSVYTNSETAITPIVPQSRAVIPKPTHYQISGFRVNDRLPFSVVSK